MISLFLNFIFNEFTMNKHILAILTNVVVYSFVFPFKSELYYLKPNFKKVIPFGDQYDSAHRCCSYGLP